MGPFAVWAVVLALLIGVALLEPREDARVAEIAPVSVIAQRVEALRGLRFEKPPEVARVTPAQAREEGLAELDEDYPPERREEDEDLYAALGLLPEDIDFRALAEDIFEEQVAGYYDPRTGRLRLVESAATSGRVAAEMTIAHELNHALEDQRFDLDTEVIARGGDEALAYQALVEGTATVLMQDYVERHFSREEALGGLLAGSFAPQADLPDFVMAQLLFSYLRGAEFIAALRRGGSSWQVVDLAFARPPVSTEQILHPEKYLRIEQPTEVPLDGRDGTFGEWQTRELLTLAGGGKAAEAAEGWGGDSYAVEDGKVTIRWVWDTPRDRREFVSALRAYVREVGRGTVTDGPGAAVTLTTSR